MSYELLRFLHVIGASVLLGTGAGIAFFMVISHRTQEPRLIAHVAGIVVLADTVFTATAALFQPITGYLLIREVGYDLMEPWVVLSLVLYVFVGMFWLPVVWIQIKMRDLARQAVADNTALPARYQRLYRIWFACGFPAFFAVLAILWLMLTRPVF
ncbi:putative integral membrane protein [Thalassovita autumnalis]|uniref:Integral membrane protein n=1 Tax=Thalassovita autumnalis TaxID=2072972 RepID=A0A0P1F832_9RHOB|nr:DUF2269 domain-containing protein [Thalassovita autumnalis]CUH63812.1 putative integral membrane protein [Thalassovita autumnalis]CUH72694.1 putative integral membrane protein [Thalassovita autumnalis]